MENFITVNERGALTLPKEIRQQVGIPNGGPMKVQVTSEGVLLVPIAAFPVEVYTKERLAEFSEEEGKLSKFKLK